MAGPFHHDVRGDTAGKGVDNEGAAAGVRTDKFPFFLNLIYTLVALVCSDPFLLVYTCQFAQHLEIPVHRLIRVIREHQPALTWNGLVLVQNESHHVVYLDGNAVSSLDGRHLNMVIAHIIPAQAGCIGVAQAGEAAEEEYVADRFEESIVSERGYGDLVYMCICSFRQVFDHHCNIGLDHPLREPKGKRLIFISLQ